MKNKTKIHRLLLLLSAALFSFSACKKDVSESDQELSAREEAIAVSASGTALSSASTSDSVYVMKACPKGNKRSEISLNQLPSSVAAYLDTNYVGYSAIKIFKIANSKTDASLNYVVVIKFNSKPVALSFSTEGAFIKVLELRQREDLRGNGWHLGGWFEHRNGLHKDTLVVSALNAAIKLYLSTAYTQDTVTYAVKNKEGSIVIISQNNGIYANIFTSGGAFVKRIPLPFFAGKIEAVANASISSNIKAYFNETYPNCVVKKVFRVKQKDTLKGYFVVIDANLTKYAVKFDASGKFVSSVVIR